MLEKEHEERKTVVDMERETERNSKGKQEEGRGERQNKLVKYLRRKDLL